MSTSVIPPYAKPETTDAKKLYISKPSSRMETRSKSDPSSCLASAAVDPDTMFSLLSILMSENVLPRVVCRFSCRLAGVGALGLELWTIARRQDYGEVRRQRRVETLSLVERKRERDAACADDAVCGSVYRFISGYFSRSWF